MKTKSLVWTLLLIFAGLGVSAQEAKTTARDYIAKYKDLAVKEMKRTGIPASITLAQGLMESGCGNSRLAKEANNHFGIKCKKTWTGLTINMTDDAPDECFRVYPNSEESYRDHSEFLVIAERYAPLFELESGDYKGWAQGLKDAGYATNPRYPDILISLVEKYQLSEFDKENPGKPAYLALKEELAKNAALAENTAPATSTDEPKKEESSPEAVKSGNEDKEPKTEAKTAEPKKTSTEPATTSATASAPAATMPSEKLVYQGAAMAVVQAGDDIAGFAKKNGLMPAQLRMYNDLCKTDALVPGTALYLKPKNRKGPAEYHIVKQGEGMFYLAQLYRVKLPRLYRINKMVPGQQPAAGEMVFLREKRFLSPKLAEGEDSWKSTGKKHFLTADEIKNPWKQSKEDSLLAAKKAKDSVIASRAPKQVNTPKDTLLAMRMDSLATSLDAEIQKNHAPYRSTSYNTQDEEEPGVATASTEVTPVLTKKQEFIVPLMIEEPAASFPARPVDKKKPTRLEVRKEEIEEEAPVVVKKKTIIKEEVAEPVQPKKLKKAYQEAEEAEEDVIPGFHTVAKGESLYAISKRYGLKVQDILDMNDMDEPKIKVGQKLKIQADKKAATPPKAKATAAPKKESIPAIKLKPAKAEEVEEYLTEEEPEPANKATIPTDKPAKNEALPSYHTVVKGESLFSISKKFHTTVAKLKSLNKLGEDKVKLGQKLRLK